MLDRLPAATYQEVTRAGLASTTKPNGSAVRRFCRNPGSVKDNKSWKTIGRAAIAAILIVPLAIGGAVGYRHFAISRLDSLASPDVRPDKPTFAPITGYTDAVWVNGWSGPHLDH